MFAIETAMRAGVSTHSRLKAAGITGFCNAVQCVVSTHSRLKAAGLFIRRIQFLYWFQHTAA